MLSGWGPSVSFAMFGAYISHTPRALQIGWGVRTDAQKPTHTLTLERVTPQGHSHGHRRTGRSIASPGPIVPRPKPRRAAHSQHLHCTAAFSSV